MTTEAERWKHLEEIGVLNPYVKRPIIRADPLLAEPVIECFTYRELMTLDTTEAR